MTAQPKEKKPELPPVEWIRICSPRQEKMVRERLSSVAPYNKWDEGRQDKNGNPISFICRREEDGRVTFLLALWFKDEAIYDAIVPTIKDCAGVEPKLLA